MTQAAVKTDEMERLRQEYLVHARSEMAAEWSEVSAPGSFGCHELLDRTAMMMSNVEEFIVSHPACLQNREWFALAQQASNALHELYRQVGEKHL